MASTAQKVEAIGATLTGSAVGFFVAGPVGLGIGLTLGAIADFLILRAKAEPVTVPPGVELPPVLAAAAAPPVSIASSAPVPIVSSTPVTLTYAATALYHVPGVMGGIAGPVTAQYTPSGAALANDVKQAHTLAAVGHGAGKEGEVWKERALVDGAGPAELAALRADGYAV